MQSIASRMLLVFVVMLGANVSMAQGISEAVCQTHQTVMTSAIFTWREHGIPIQVAKDQFNYEDNWELRFYLRNVVAQIYKDPDGSWGLFSSGTFMKQCLEIHRGY